MSRVLLMVGTRRGAFLFRSDEKRQTWQMDGPLLKGWEVMDLTLDQRGDRVLYASTADRFFGSRIRISRDLGRHWDEIAESPSYPESSGRRLNRIWCVVPGHVDEPEVLYAGVDEAGLFASHDGGRRWREVTGLNDHETRGAWCQTHGGLSCHTVRVDPADPRRVWVAISAAGVFRTDDGGRSWQVKNGGIPMTVPSEQFDDMAACVHSLVVTSDAPAVLYQQNHTGLFRSRDGGDTWQRIEQGLASNFGLPMAIHPNDRHCLYTSPIMESQTSHLPIDGKLVVYRSRDGGESWEALEEGLPRSHYYAFILRHGMAVDGLEECGVYLGTTGGHLFYSRDGGETWQAMPGFDLLPRVLSVKAVVLD